MKKKILLGSILALALTVTSCRDEFLQTEPTQTLSNPPAQAKLNGLYLTMVNTGTGGTSGHDDFGQKGYDIISDFLSSDMVLAASNYGWYRNLVNFSVTLDYTQTMNYIPWRYYYRLIYGTNEIINSLGGNDAVPTIDEDKYAMGQAKALRAYSYFYLLQLYTPEYLPNAEAIPIYLDMGVEAKAKSNQSEVYAQIVKDLTEAVSLLDGFNRGNKGMVNKYVAQGMLAYVYAAMGNNADASVAALDVMNNSGAPLTTNIETVRMNHNGSDVASGGGFNDLATRSWLWGFDLTLENGLDLVSWWGQVDLFTYSYAWAGDPKAIDVGLYAKIKDGDIRKNQFATLSTARQNMPINKFFAPERRIGGQRNITTDYIYMRVDEFHLLAAETLAKSGNDAQAKTILKDFMKNRIEDATLLAENDTYIDGLSNTALLDEIYLNTRIEFWGEGKSYLALKRNKGTVVRGANHLFNVGESIPYNDNRLYLKIPQNEQINNPFIN